MISAPPPKTAWERRHLVPVLLCSVTCSSVHGILQARILKWVAISSCPTQGSNPCLLCLLRWQVDSLPLSHPGSPGLFPDSWPINLPSGFHWISAVQTFPTCTFKMLNTENSPWVSQLLAHIQRKYCILLWRAFCINLNTVRQTQYPRERKTYLITLLTQEKGFALRT